MHTIGVHHSSNPRSPNPRNLTLKPYRKLDLTLVLGGPGIMFQLQYFDLFPKPLGRGIVLYKYSI